jgi:deazaflavin-dependent oxidoreductase (nitroreductase family)
MSSTPFIFRLLNPVMKGVLRSPLHSMLSDRIMIITFTGRKTGQDYSTPVSYCQENGTVSCFTHASWWKNLVGGASVRLQIRGREHSGIATPIDQDREKKIAGLAKLLGAVPWDAGFYNVTIDQQGRMDPKDLASAADNATMIEVYLDE